MKNFFENAKFGDKFLTRDGRKALYLYEGQYPEEYFFKLFCLETGEFIETDVYNGVTLDDGVEKGCGTDIVSRYQEPIDE